MIIYYIVVFSMPLVEHKWFGYEIAGLTIEKYVGLLALVYAFAYLSHRKLMPRFFEAPQAVIFLIFVLLTLVSYVFTAEAFTLRDTFGIFLPQLFFYLSTVIVIDSMKRLENTVLAMIAGISFLSLHMIFEWVRMAPIYGLDYRPGYVAGDPNTFATSAVAYIPYIIYVLMHPFKRWHRWAALGALGLTGFATMLSGSRGGMLAVVPAVFGMLRGTRYKWRLAALLSVALVMALVFTPAAGVERLLHPDRSDLDSTQARLNLWDASLRMMKDHPLTGVGIWHFSAALRQYEPTSPFNVPHNTYLHIGTELGIPALLAYLLIIGLSLVGYQKLRRRALAANQQLFFGLASAGQAGLVAFCIASFFMSASNLKVFWFVIYLSCCLPQLFSVLMWKQKQAAPVTARVAEPEQPRDVYAARNKWSTAGGPRQ